MDIPGRFEGHVSVWLARIACVFVGVGLAVVLRLGIDLIAPGVAPFAMAYPASLAAALLGGWQSGLAALFVTQILAWMFVLPTVGGLHTSTQLASAVIVAITGTMVVLVGEGSPNRLSGLLAAEKKRVARVAFDVPIHDYQVGDGPGQIPLSRLQRKIMKLPRDLKGTEVADLNFRLKALPLTLQAPKGPMPRGGRQPKMPRPRAR